MAITDPMTRFTSMREQVDSMKDLLLFDHFNIDWMKDVSKEKGVDVACVLLNIDINFMLLFVLCWFIEICGIFRMVICIAKEIICISKRGTRWELNSTSQPSPAAFRGSKSTINHTCWLRQGRTSITCCHHQNGDIISVIF